MFLQKINGLPQYMSIMYKCSTVRATHWFNTIMNSNWDMTLWHMPRLDQYKNCDFPGYVKLVLYDLNISFILYYREMNTWRFLRIYQFINVKSLIDGYRPIIVRDIEMFSSSLQRLGEIIWSAIQTDKKIMFYKNREYL